MRRRRAIALTGVTAAAALVVISGSHRLSARQTPAPPTSPTQQPAAPTPSAQPPGKLEFASEAGLILSPIQSDRTAVFEEVISRVHEALAKSADPVRKQQAAGWKVYRAHEPYQNATLYVSVMDPAVKGADYSVYRVLMEGLGEVPARELFEKYRDAHVGGQHVLSLTSVAKSAL